MLAQSGSGAASYSLTSNRSTCTARRSQRSAAALFPTPASEACNVLSLPSRAPALGRHVLKVQVQSVSEANDGISSRSCKSQICRW